MFNQLLHTILFLALHFTTVAQKPSYHWGNVLIGGGGYVVGVKLHPKKSDLVFVRTDVGGMYRWNKATGTLVQLFNWVPDSKANLYGIAGMALHPTDEKIIYAGAGKYIENNPHGVFKSVDGGATWRDLNFPARSPFDVNRGNADHRFGNPIELNPGKPSELWVGTVRDGLWIYNEHAKQEKWRQVKDIPTGYSIRNIEFDKTTENVYVGIRSRGVYRSKDDGQTFSLVPGSEAFTIQDMDLSKGGDKLFLATESEGIQRLDDARSGATWTDVSPAGFKEDGMKELIEHRLCWKRPHPRPLSKGEGSRVR